MACEYYADSDWRWPPASGEAGLRLILAVGVLGAALVLVSRGFGADIGGDRRHPRARRGRRSRRSPSVRGRGRETARTGQRTPSGAVAGRLLRRLRRRLDRAQPAPDEALIGRKLAIAHDYRRWDEAPFIEPEHRRLAAGGRILLLNWKPRRENDAGPWAQIARGLQDARIDSVARQVKRFRRPLFLTFHHEPEDGVGVYGGVDDYARAFGSSPASGVGRPQCGVRLERDGLEPLRGIPLRAMRATTSWTGSPGTPTTGSTATGATAIGSSSPTKSGPSTAGCACTATPTSPSCSASTAPMSRSPGSQQRRRGSCAPATL